MIDVRDTIQDSISSALAGEGEFITKWAITMETVGLDGERGIWTMSNDDAKPWDVMGMLRFALVQEEANVAHNYAINGDDD